MVATQAELIHSGGEQTARRWVGPAGARGAARRAWCAAGIVIGLVFGTYPNHLTGRYAFVLSGGLIGIISHKANRSRVDDLHLGLLISWNLFIVTGMALFAIMLVTAWRARKEADAPS
jgi:hypothetical protein